MIKLIATFAALPGYLWAHPGLLVLAGVVGVAVGYLTHRSLKGN